MTSGDTSWALLFDTDLFFSVRISESLARAGRDTRTVRRIEAFTAALAQQPPIALVNLAARGVDWRTAITACAHAGVPLIAFGPHVAIETQTEARQLGATTVVAYSQLMDDLPALIERTRRRAARRLDSERADITAESSQAPSMAAQPGERTE